MNWGSLGPVCKGYVWRFAFELNKCYIYMMATSGMELDGGEEWQDLT